MSDAIKLLQIDEATPITVGNPCKLSIIFKGSADEISELHEDFQKNEIMQQLQKTNHIEFNESNMPTEIEILFHIPKLSESIKNKIEKPQIEGTNTTIKTSQELLQKLGLKEP